LASHSVDRGAAASRQRGKVCSSQPTDPSEDARPLPAIRRCVTHGRIKYSSTRGSFRMPASASRSYSSTVIRYRSRPGRGEDGVDSMMVAMRIALPGSMEWPSPRYLTALASLSLHSVTTTGQPWDRGNSTGPYVWKRERAAEWVSSGPRNPAHGIRLNADDGAGAGPKPARQDAPSVREGGDGGQEGARRGKGEGVAPCGGDAAAAGHGVGNRCVIADSTHPTRFHAPYATGISS